MKLDPERGAAELLSAHARRAGAPVTLILQVTDRCNYNCIHCYEIHGRDGELAFSEIVRILDEAAALGVLFLTLTGGEPFMRRDADDILRAARARGFAVKLLTTGHFIDDRRADLIRDLGCVQVEMSFYAAEPCVHDEVTQTRGSWERTLRAARRLRERDVTVVLKSPVMNLNAAGLEDLARLATDLGCAFAFDPKVTGREDGDAGPTTLRASDATLRAFYANEPLGIWQDISAEHTGCGPTPGGGRPLDSTPCRAGQEVLAIGSTGQVFGCNSLTVAAGDVRAQGLGAIWRDSAELERLRQLTWARIHGCNECDVRDYCSRCHAMAHLEDGRIDGPSREACRHAVIIRDLLRDRGLIPANDTALPPPLTRRPGVRPSALRVLS